MMIFSEITSEIDILTLFAAQQTFIVNILRSSTVMSQINIYKISYSLNNLAYYCPHILQERKPLNLGEIKQQHHELVSDKIRIWTHVYQIIKTMLFFQHQIASLNIKYMCYSQREVIHFGSGSNIYFSGKHSVGVERM